MTIQHMRKPFKLRFWRWGIRLTTYWGEYNHTYLFTFHLDYDHYRAKRGVQE